ncbi:MAG TPA: hypothetical protein VLC28_03670 [Flavitalea sp.]|nr:hypothetical protein [Flavitalea sp.]
MKFIKLTLISLALLMLLVTVIAMLIPSHVRISRAIDVKGSRENIMKQLGDLRQWRSWNEFVVDSMLKSPQYMEKSIQSTGLTVTLQRASGDTVIAEWKNDHQQLLGGFNLIPSHDQFVVQWYFDFYQDWYPWEKFASIGFDKQYGPLMENSLSLLKKRVEVSE